MTTAKELQERLMSMGFPLPKYGADGKPGNETWDAMTNALDELETRRKVQLVVKPPAADGKIDRAEFYSALKKQGLFGGKLSTSQVNGLDAILDEWEKRGYTDKRWLAYALATAYHETGQTMQPVVENLNYTSAGLLKTFKKYFTPAEAVAYAKKPQAIANRVYANRNGNGNEASGDGWKYRGRGLPQITFHDNYAKFGIANNPDKALEMPMAVKIMFDGMVDGMFTGHKLADYFNATKTDWVNARRIINALDKADEIAGHAKKINAALASATA